MEELLDIDPPEDEMYHLRQSDGVLDKPFCEIISTGEMEEADTLSVGCLRELGVRAGYLRPATIYDFRSEACTSSVYPRYFRYPPKFFG